MTVAEFFHPRLIHVAVERSPFFPFPRWAGIRGDEFENRPARSMMSKAQRGFVEKSFTWGIMNQSAGDGGFPCFICRSEKALSPAPGSRNEFHVQAVVKISFHAFSLVQFQRDRAGGRNIQNHLLRSQLRVKSSSRWREIPRLARHFFVAPFKLRPLAAQQIAVPVRGVSRIVASIPQGGGLCPRSRSRPATRKFLPGFAQRKLTDPSTARIIPSRAFLSLKSLVQSPGVSIIGKYLNVDWEPGGPPGLSHLI